MLKSDEADFCENSFLSKFGEEGPKTRVFRIENVIRFS